MASEGTAERKAWIGTLSLICGLNGLNLQDISLTDDRCAFIRASKFRYVVGSDRSLQSPIHHSHFPPVSCILLFKEITI